MVDELDKDVTAKNVLGYDVSDLCCGLLYQMCGAFDCCLYACGRMFRAEEDPEREKTVAYYLDIWALVVLGTTSVITVFSLILHRWSLSFLDPQGFGLRYD